jgi:hypothetical protein
MPFYYERQKFTGKRSAFSYHVEAALLWNEVNMYLGSRRSQESKEPTLAPWQAGSRFLQLEKLLMDFQKSLPPEMCYSRRRLEEIPDFVGIYVHTHAEFNAAMFLLYSSVYPYVPRRVNAPNEQPPPKEFIEKAAKMVRESANAQASMMEDILAHENITVTPFVAFCTYTVSVAHIALSFSKDPQVALTAKQHLSVILRLLLDLRDLFPIVGMWCVVLKKRYLRKSERFAALENAGSTAQQGEAFSRPGTPPVYLPEDLIKANDGATSPFDKSGSMAASRIASRQASRAPSRESSRPGSPGIYGTKRKREDNNDGMTLTDPTMLTADAPLPPALSAVDPSSVNTTVFEVEPETSNASTLGIDLQDEFFFTDTGAQWLNAFDLTNDLVLNDVEFLTSNQQPENQLPDTVRHLDFDVEREESILRHILDTVVDVPRRDSNDFPF